MENERLEQLCKSIKTFETLSMDIDNRNKLYQYNDALMQSLYSIIEDRVCSEAEKMDCLKTTLEEYATAMFELIPKLCETAKREIAPIDKADRFDVIEEIEKFNPYHDRLGRFATADGAASFTYKPGQGKMYDNAIAREKERSKADEIAANIGMYPARIAGVKRGEPMSHEQADQGNANPNFSKGGGYWTNCQSCVVAYEARRRGYDVITKPNTKGSKLSELSRQSSHAWIDPKTGKVAEFERNTSVTTPTKCRKWLEETIQPGERYTFGHQWKGRTRSGHIIHADKNESGELRLFDPQNGKTMTGKDADYYMSRIRYTSTFYGQKVYTGPKLLRVDNKQFNMEYADNIMEAKA